MIRNDTKLAAVLFCLLAGAVAAGVAGFTLSVVLKAPALFSVTAAGSTFIGIGGLGISIVALFNASAPQRLSRRSGPGPNQMR